MASSAETGRYSTISGRAPRRWSVLSLGFLEERPVLRQCAILGLFLVGFYLPAFGVTLNKSVSTGPIDTHRLRETLYSSPAQAVASLVFDLLPPPTENVFVIGGSNVEMGLRPSVIGQYLDSSKVIHNIAIRGSNFTLTTEQIDLLEAHIGKEGLRKSSMIIGIHYIQFVEDSVKWPTGFTDLHQALESFSFYQVSGHQIRPNLTPNEHQLAVNALRPYLFLNRCYRDAADGATTVVRELLRGHPLSKLSAFGYVAKVDDEIKRNSLVSWARYMNRPSQTLSDEQFERMGVLLRRLVDAGAEVVVVDLPLPSWHRAGTPLFADFQTRKMKYIDPLKSLRGIAYLNLQEALSDADFYDSAHPTEAGSEKLSRQLGTAISRGGLLRLKSIQSPPQPPVAHEQK